MGTSCTRSRSASPSGNPPRTTLMSAAGAHEPSCSRLFVCGQVLPFSNLAERKFSAGLAGTLAAAQCKQAALGRFYSGSLSNRECLTRQKNKGGTPKKKKKKKKKKK